MTREAVGPVVRITARGSALVQGRPTLPILAAGAPRPEKGRTAARIGARVVDARNAEVGRITDVIGPVNAPHLVVSPPRGAKIHRLQGKELYLK